MVRSVALRATNPPRLAAQAAGMPVVLGASATSSLDGIPQALQLPNGEQLELSPEQQAVAASVQRQHQLVSLAQKQPEVLAQVIDFWLNDNGRRR
jgi:hypothetical protein